MTKKDAAAATPWRPAGFEEPHEPRDDQRCTARAKTTGERCKQWAMRGTTVCRHHGGAAKQVRAAAQRRLAAEKIERDAGDALAYHVPEGVTDPFEVLSQVAAEAVELKDALGARANSLRKLRYSAHGAGTEQIRGEIQLYERALDRVGKLVKLMIDTGFEERRVRLSEQHGAMIAEVFRRVLTAHGVDVTPGSPAAQMVVAELRALSEADR